MVVAAVAALACRDASDCGYNGQCSSGRCVCSAPWRGPECQSLDLIDVPREAGYHLPNTSSWGGAVLHGDDGRLYMYAAEMVAHCGIGAWTRNSRIILASADNLSSPFRFEKELFGVFAHEPAATRAPTGEYVLYFTSTRLGCGDLGENYSHGSCIPDSLCPAGNTTGCNPGGPTCWTQCAAGITASSCFDERQEASPYVRFPTYMAYATHPLGPYSEPAMVYNGSDQAGSGLSAPATGDTNMAGVIFADGSLAGMWRGDRKQENHQGPVYQYQYAVFAENWKNPRTYNWGFALQPFNIFPSLVGPNDTRNCGIEDPTLWIEKVNVSVTSNAEGGRLEEPRSMEKEIVHAVVHNWKAGGHAVSDDRGRTWRWFGGVCSSTAGASSVDWGRSVWPQNVTFSDGGVETPHRRERPHIVVDTRSRQEKQDSCAVVSALTTSYQKIYGKDHTWTLVQQVG